MKTAVSRLFAHWEISMTHFLLKQEILLKFSIFSFVSVSFSSLLSILRKKKDVSAEIALVEKDSSEKTPGKEWRAIRVHFQFINLLGLKVLLYNNYNNNNKCKDYLDWSFKSTVISDGWWFKVFSLICFISRAALQLCSSSSHMKDSDVYVDLFEQCWISIRNLQCIPSDGM